MAKKKGISIVLLIPTIIIGVALFEQFDFENFKIEKPALAVVYLIGLVLSIIFLVSDYKKPPQK